MYRSTVRIATDTISRAMIVTDRGVLTKEQMLDMLRPGALDPQIIQGRRVRWATSSTRSDAQDTKRVSDELKQRHLQLGAAEVLVHSARFQPEPA